MFILNTACGIKILSGGKRIRRNNMPPLENYYVCSEHFSAESIEVNLRAQITGTKCKRRLKKDAIPSIGVLFSSSGEEAEAV